MQFESNTPSLCVTLRLISRTFAVALCFTAKAAKDSQKIAKLEQRVEPRPLPLLIRG
jgi:hypothetical protein